MKENQIQIKQQQGAALIVGLIVLLLMTIMGLSAMQGTSLQEKMSGNLRDTTLAFNASEAALRYAEEGLIATLDDADKGKLFSNCSSGCQIVDSDGNTDANTALQNGAPSWDAAAIAYGSLKDGSGNNISLPSGSELNSSTLVVNPPKVMVEYIRFKKDALDTGGGTTEDKGIVLYRTTAKAQGGSTNAEVILQTIYGRRFQ